ncbi:MAG: hypothetical protein JNL11_11565 [Bdellovibrionaceae bacterium]|nr:hypothetical protein [Pseudobdellovibrionaceae bacterium]
MENEIALLLIETLKLPKDRISFTKDTQLLGAIPEMDSLMVVKVLEKLEEKFKIRIEDDEIDGSVFKTLGSLSDFISLKTKDKS